MFFFFFRQWLFNNCKGGEKLARTENSPEIEHGARALPVDEHVLSVVDAESVQEAFDGLESSRDAGPARHVLQPLVHGKVRVPDALAAEMPGLENKLALHVLAKAAWRAEEKQCEAEEMLGTRKSLGREITCDRGRQKR